MSAEIVLAAVAARLLLFPAYRSTDFEVHRNWLAVTYARPLQEWYFEDTSQWTLDYPPFFAAFEWALAQLAARVDPEMVAITEDLAAPSPRTVAFQRASVVAADAALALGVWAVARACAWPRAKTATALALALFSPGLLLLDHVHFQYNGMLFGLLLLSVAALRHGGRDVLGAALFAAVLMWKQIFLYVAPLYFVYLLRHYCSSVRRFATLGAVVLAVFALALGPLFAATAPADRAALLLQLKDRLFPFKRGLCHAYWAPNVWALYSFADRALLAVSGGSGGSGGLSTTGGLVHDAPAAVLPTITPIVTVALAAAAMAPALALVWRSPRPRIFLPALAYVSFCSFHLGWHVHEKAVMMALVPLSLVALDDGGGWGDGPRAFLLTLATGTYSLFPLFFTPAEDALKLGLGLAGFVGAYAALGRPAFSRLERAYLAGLLALFAYVHAGGHALLFADRMPFLPLMFTSVYCALGLLYCWGLTWGLCRAAAEL